MQRPTRDWLTVREAAKRAWLKHPHQPGVHEQTVRNWLRRYADQLVVDTIEGSSVILIHWPSLEAWLRARRESQAG